MMTLSLKGKNIAQQLKGEYDRKKLMTGKSVKWTEVFGSVEEIIATLKAIPFNVNVTYPNPYTGYEYIHSFAKAVQSGKELSEAQIRQTKKLATQIRIAYEIRNEWK